MNVCNHLLESICRRVFFTIFMIKNAIFAPKFEEFKNVIICNDMAKTQTYSIFEARIKKSLKDYKNEKITKKIGEFRKKPNDMVLPEEFDESHCDTPAMLYSGIIDEWKEIQKSDFKYKPHIYSFKHIASSQTACVNLFIPILTNANADEILRKSGIAPKDFDRIARRNSRYEGFHFEFGVGDLLEDNSGVITDADVSIAYLNKNGEKCLWLIEHKLTEKDFTHCGGYKSNSTVMKDNLEYKENCTQCSMAEILANPDLCYYHAVSKYKYWEIMNEYGGKEFFSGKYDDDGCPFRLGMNQLWRNQLLALALENKPNPYGYKHVCFSVVKHPDNPSLDKSIEKYKKLTNNSPKFSVFTSLDLIRAAQDFVDLKDWISWYKRVYHIMNE